MTWGRLTGAAAVWTAVLMVSVGVGLTDVEAVAMGVGLWIGAFLLRWRKGLLGRLVLVVLFADVAFWMAPAAVTNIAHGEDLTAVAAPLAIGAAAVLGLMADIVMLVTRTRAERGAGRVVVLAVLLLAGAVAASQLELFGDPVEARPGDLPLRMKDVKFVPDELRSVRFGGSVTVVVANADLFWHTFTIEDLDVDVRVPVRARRRITFRAPAGTYRIVCAIPGHESVGMKGTLTVP